MNDNNYLKRNASKTLPNSEPSKIEKWDAYDKYFNKIPNIELIRGTKVPDGIYHLVTDIVVKHIDGTYLLMLRDFNKHRGGLWELTAGGSAILGENPIQCAHRELKEETGIVSINLKEISRVVSDERHAIYVEYFCITDCDKSSIILQDGETIDYKWVPKETLFNMPKEQFSTLRTIEIVKKLNL